MIFVIPTWGQHSITEDDTWIVSRTRRLGVSKEQFCTVIFSLSALEETPSQFGGIDHGSLFVTLENMRAEVVHLNLNMNTKIYRIYV